MITCKLSIFKLINNVQSIDASVSSTIWRNYSVMGGGKHREEFYIPPEENT